MGDNQVLCGRGFLTYRWVGSLLRVADFTIHDDVGAEIGRVREWWPSRLHAYLRPLGRLDPLATHRLVVWERGRPVLRILRPPGILRMRVALLGPEGEEIIRLVQPHTFRGIEFSIASPSSEPIGSLRRERDEQGRRFALRGASGGLVATVRTVPDPLTALARQPPEYVLEIADQAPVLLRKGAIATPPVVHLAFFSGRL